MRTPLIHATLVAGLIAVGAAAGPPQHAAPQAAPANAKQEYPPFDKVIEGLEKVVSTTDGSKPLYELYRDKKTGKLLGVLPANYAKQLIMIACTISGGGTISGGDPEAGVMGPTHYVKWRKINKQLVLVEPNLFVRTSGDKTAKKSIDQLYTGRVVVATPILTEAPGGRPVIDLGTLAMTQAAKFFGSSVWGPYGPSLAGLNPALATLKKTKAFPESTRPRGRTAASCG
jgi:hypothetical protein